MNSSVLNILSVILFFGITSCNQPTSKVNIEELKQHGDSLTNIAQKTLMGTLLAAIEQEGHEYALDFCNVRAMPTTDSLSNAMKVTIQRLSQKNRNPQNAITNKNDQVVFDYFNENKSVKDTLLIENSKDIYYKRINLAMPACTQCHGKEIEPNLLAKIKTLYPEDKATGYELNDFRGMWKVTYNQ